MLHFLLSSTNKAYLASLLRFIGHSLNNIPPYIQKNYSIQALVSQPSLWITAETKSWVYGVSTLIFLSLQISISIYFVVMARKCTLDLILKWIGLIEALVQSTHSHKYWIGELSDVFEKTIQFWCPFTTNKLLINNRNVFVENIKILFYQIVYSMEL